MDRIQGQHQYGHFKRRFLLAFALYQAADWLQGPYLYALYASYGLSHAHISLLFVVGFASSGTLGSFVGSVADRCGRRLVCMGYGALFAASCVLAMQRSLAGLVLGRVVGGVSTSILTTTLEVWAVHRHHELELDEGLLGSDLFPAMGLLTSGTAIAAGMLGYALVSLLGLGLASPFQAAVLFCATGTAVIYTQWPENYGTGPAVRDDRRQGNRGGGGGGGGGGHSAAVAVVAATSGRGSSGGGGAGLAAVRRACMSPRAVLVLTFQSCFEASMYIFVVMWTPTLEADYSGSPDALPLGGIFAFFMLCCAAGTRSLKLMPGVAGSTITAAIGAVAAVAMLTPMLSTSLPLVIGAFCVFEVSVGIYFPTISAMRTAAIDDVGRATVLTASKLFYNLIVAVVFFNMGRLGRTAPYGVCVGLLAIGVASQLLLRWHLGEPESRFSAVPASDEPHHPRSVKTSPRAGGDEV